MGNATCIYICMCIAYMILYTTVHRYAEMCVLTYWMSEHAVHGWLEARCIRMLFSGHKDQQAEVRQAESPICSARVHLLVSMCS